jgi:hypothetical protein
MKKLKCLCGVMVIYLMDLLVVAGSILVVYINFICCVLLFLCTGYSGYSGYCGVRVDSVESSSKIKYLIDLELLSIV